MKVNDEVKGRIAIALAEYAVTSGRINPDQYVRAMTVALQASKQEAKANCAAFDHTLWIKNSIAGLKNSGNSQQL